jgi:hypothetical protein
MQFFMNLWNRIRKFDPRRLTPMQIILGIATAIIALWLVGVVLQAIMAIFNFLVPVAIAILAGYFGFQWLRNRADKMPDTVSTKSRQDRAVEEAVANVEAAESGRQIVIEETTATADTEEEEREDPLVIKQVVNPETGFKEPDIARLIEREESMLKEADQVNDAVISQLEARRRRLLGQEDEGQG